MQQAGPNLDRIDDVRPLRTDDYVYKHLAGVGPSKRDDAKRAVTDRIMQRRVAALVSVAPQFSLLPVPSSRMIRFGLAPLMHL